MPDNKPFIPHMRINLAEGLTSTPDDPPTAGTVNVTFDGSAGTVTIPADTSVSVDKNKMKVLFDLTAQNIPAGAAAIIQGIEFAKPVEPTGTFAPDKIFDDPATFNDGTGAAHTVYGKWKGGSNNELKLVDNNNVRTGTAEQDYAFRVWIKVTDGATTTYYASADPQVVNKPTT
ncbi:MAG TPA: hypothetical protein VFX92_13515 [Candidatus Krumholzibacteria bacterium]|nr:hypothetical protein [Candidatus Krumholzibacteria bacterium]